MSGSLWPHGLSPWNSPGQNTGVGSLSLLQTIFPTQGSNPGLPRCRQILYQLNHKGSPFHSNPKERQCQRMVKLPHYDTIAVISHTGKVMLKILQARLQQYVNCELWVVQAGFRKGRGTRDQIANICWVIEKAREFQENIYFCFINYAKAFDCVDHSKLWKILKEMGIPDHLTCLLRNLYSGQEATVRTGHGTTDWLQIRKGIHQVCI